MTQGRIPEEEELKESLIDEILSKVNQDQGDDVPQQALEHSPPFLKGEV